MNSKYALNPHALVRFLEKDAKDFTKEDHSLRDGEWD